MDFMNRSFRNSQPNTQNTDHAAGTTSTVGHTASKSSSGKKLPNNFVQAGKLGFFILLAILIVGILLAVVTFRSTREATLVDESKYQAVFLNGGQVYFGKVNTLNDQYVNMNNVYYLRVNQQVQPDANAQQSSNDISLVKLGCELHGPQDQMVINREQVIFWENLKEDGQVAKAIAEYQKLPAEQRTCESQAANQNSNNNTNNNSSESNSTDNTNTGNQTGN